MCMRVESVWMCLYHMPACYIPMPKEGTGSLETGVTDWCKQPCSVWESNKLSARATRSHNYLAIYLPSDLLFVDYILVILRKQHSGWII